MRSVYAFRVCVRLGGESGVEAGSLLEQNAELRAEGITHRRRLREHMWVERHVIVWHISASSREQAVERRVEGRA